MDNNILSSADEARQRNRVLLVGTLLRRSFDADDKALPQAFVALLASLAAAGQGLSDEEFARDLVAITARLRNYARRLAGQADSADDIVQQALMKAWAKRHQFRPGTSFAAWMHTIVHNEFLSSRRRGRFTADWSDTAAERVLVAPAVQDKGLELADLNSALRQLPALQREALLLTGPGGLTYEEAAAISGCALGTIKSRVFRARQAVEAMYERSDQKRRARAPSGSALDDMMQATNEVLARRAMSLND